MVAWQENEGQIVLRIREALSTEKFSERKLSEGVSLTLGSGVGETKAGLTAVLFDSRYTLESAKAWWEKNKTERFALPNTFDVPGVEIFAAGTWNGDTYTVGDLDAMVAAFNATKDKIKPYLKLGHGDEQSLLRSDELPAAGWISNLRREGKKLLADFVRVPQKIYDLITSGGYRRVSSEIYWNFTLDGEKYPKMLKAVALLGGETPAVHDLGDIIGLFTLGGEVAYSTDARPKTYEVSQGDLKQSEESEMEIEALKKSLSEAEGKLAEATKSVEVLKKDNAEKDAQIKKLSDDNAAMAKKLSDLEVAKKHSEIKAKIDKLITDKKIIPAQKEMLFTLLSNLPESAEKKYTLGEKSYNSLEEVAMAFVESSHQAPTTGGTTEQGEPLNVDLEEKAKKYAKDNKVSYKAALIAVSKAEKGE